MTHAHFDLDDAERQLRAHYAQMMAPFRARVLTEPEADRLAFTANLDWQERFFEVQVLAVRTMIDAGNQGRAVGSIAEDLGHCLGAIMATFARSQPHAAGVLETAIQESFMNLMNGVLNRRYIKLKPMQAGHA